MVCFLHHSAYTPACHKGLYWAHSCSHCMSMTCLNLLLGVSLFADDTGQLCANKNPSQLHIDMQSGIDAIIQWMNTWHLRPNATKTKAMFVSSSPPTDPLFFPGSSKQPIEVVKTHQHLGVFLDSNLSWESYIEYICRRTSSIVGCYNHICLICLMIVRSCFIVAMSCQFFDYGDTSRVVWF